MFIETKLLINLGAKATLHSWKYASLVIVLMFIVTVSKDLIEQVCLLELITFKADIAQVII